MNRRLSVKSVNISPFNKLRYLVDMIMGLTHLLLMLCDSVRNSSQALTSGETAASNPLIRCSTDVNCSIISHNNIAWDKQCT